MQRRASAEWRGTFKEGAGTVSTASKVLSDTAYDSRSRFEDGTRTNPEELLAAAHASCFSMALSVQLGHSGWTPDWIRTQATAEFEKVDMGWSITSIHLDVRAKVPGADRAGFEKAADAAKTGCPISRALHTRISMTATLEG
jgi:osmotically inducible protein OsmC